MAYKISMIYLPAARFPEKKWPGDTPPCARWYELLVRPTLRPQDVLQGVEATAEHCKYFVRHP